VPQSIDNLYQGIPTYAEEIGRARMGICGGVNHQMGAIFAMAA